MKKPEVKWSVYEHSVQAYRMINISSQAFLLAVGAFLSNRRSYVFYAVVVTALTMIWWVWVRTTVSRHLIADYYKIAMELEDDKLQDFEVKCNQEEYVHNAEKRASANEYGPFKTNWRPTRIKLDRWLPRFYTFIWLALLAEQFYKDFIKKCPF